MLSDHGASLSNSTFRLKATWLEKKGILLDSGRLRGFEIVTFRSHDTTLKVIRLFCRSQHATSRLVLGVLELFCGSHYMTLWRQGGHTLQDFWPRGIPDKTVRSADRVLSRKNMQEGQREMMRCTHLGFISLIHPVKGPWKMLRKGRTSK